MGWLDWLKKQLGTHPSKSPYVLQVTKEDYVLLCFAGATHIAITEPVRKGIKPSPIPIADLARQDSFVHELMLALKGFELAAGWSFAERAGLSDMPLFLSRDSLLGARLLVGKTIWLVNELERNGGTINGWSLPSVGEGAEPPLADLKSLARTALSLEEKLAQVELEHGTRQPNDGQVEAAILALMERRKAEEEESRMDLS